MDTECTHAHHTHVQTIIQLTLMHNIITDMPLEETTVHVMIM